MILSYKPPYTQHNNDHHYVNAISVITNSTNYGVDKFGFHKDKIETRLGIDSHADISCAGRHARIVSVIEGSMSTVHAFSDSIKPIKNIRTVNVAYAYDTGDGKTYILRVNHCLDFTDKMQHSILCTNQVRANNIVVDDVPKLFDYENKSKQAITLQESGILFPILFHGPVPFLPIRYPSDSEMLECEHIHLTSQENWDIDLYPDLNQKYEISSIQGHASYDTLDHFLTIMYENINIGSVQHMRYGKFTPSLLSNRFNIDLKTAARTLDTTVQSHVRTSDSDSIERRFKTIPHQRQYRQLGGYLGQFASDTFKANVESLRGNQYYQLFCNKGNFTHGMLISKKSDAQLAFDRFLHEVGIPSEIITDGAKELHLGKWASLCQRHSIRQKLTEPFSPWQNPAELQGGIIKRKVRNLMRRTGTFVRLWDYCYDYVTNLRSVIAHDHAYLDSVTPYQKVLGYAPNISEYLQHDWFQWVFYHDPTDPDRELIGRWLGPAHSVGQGLAYFVLTRKGTVVTRSTVIPIPESVLIERDNIDQRSKFMSDVTQTIGNNSQSTLKASDIKVNDPYDNIFIDEEEMENYQCQSEISIEDLKPLDDHVVEHPGVVVNDNFIGCKVNLPLDGELMEGTVRDRKRNADGMLLGKKDDNPLLDSSVYIVDFPDGSYREYNANLIAENLYSQIDDEGRSFEIFKGISDHKFDENFIPKEQGWTTLPNGARKRVITTAGCHLLVEWDNGTSDWVELKDLKQSNPIEVAEYAVSAGIADEPAFAWWVNYVLKKRQTIINKIKNRRVKKNIKFGIEIPQDTNEANALDAANNNDLWKRARDKELERVVVSFKLLADGEEILPGYKKIPYHIIYDVKFDLTRKARLVAGGHKHRDVPSYATYSSVVSRDSVRIMFLLAALNSLKVLAGDVGNAYLNAPCQEKVYVIVGPEIFGPEAAGKPAYIVRSLYGLRSAGNAWREHLSNTIINDLGYTRCMADPDVYMKVIVRASGEKCYSYIACYVDDILVLHDEPKRIMDQIGSIYRMKEGSVEKPSIYLGANIREWFVQNEDGISIPCYGMSSSGYVKEAIRIVEALMKQYNLTYTSTRRQGRHTPFSNVDYRPELDCTTFCNDELITVYQNLIGMLRWICELGRVDV